MSQRIADLSSVSRSDLTPEIAAGEDKGSFMGESVSLRQDITSLLQDAAEELTFSASEDVERKLTERKQNKEKNRSLEQILFYVEHAQDMDPNDLERLLKQLAAMKDHNAAAVADTVGQAFSDPTSRHAALSYARAKMDELELDEESARTLTAAIDEALRDLEESEGRAVRAGYNIVGVKAPETGLDAPGLRLLYRDTVLDFESYEKTFAAMLEKFGPEEFPKAINYLVRALGSDMTALTPSSPAQALKEVMDGLYMVESLGTLYADAASLAQRMHERHGTPPEGLSEQAIIKPLLHYKSMPALTESQVRADMPFLLSDNAARDAELTQGVRELARKMPHKLYSSMEVRQDVLRAFQYLLDDAVDREELEMEE